MSRRDLEAAAHAAQELGRRRQYDALRAWRPYARRGEQHSGQVGFLESPKPECWLLGANKSGKTDALAALIASFARFGNPDPRPCYMNNGGLVVMDRAVAIWAISVTFPVLRDTLQPKLFQSPYGAGESHAPFIPPWEIETFRISDNVLLLKNGSNIAFKSGDAGREIFQGASRDLIAFDEVPPLPVYTECTFRLGGGDGHRLLIRGAATILPPEGVIGGIAWLYDKKVKPWLQADRKHTELDIFPVAMRDNPYLNPNEIDRLEEQYPPGSLERRVRIDGELLPSIGGVLAYPAFNRVLHVDPSLGPHSVVPQYPLRLLCDFNVAPCVWVVGQRINDTWLFYDEIVMSHGNLPLMVDEFRRRYPTHKGELYLQGDATAQFRSAQTGLSHWYVVQEALQNYPVPVRLLVPRQNPNVVDRLNAVNRQLKRADGRIGALFSPQCTECIADGEETLRDPKGGIKKASHPTDPYNARTHGFDACGYGIAYDDPVPRSRQSVYGMLGRIPRPSYQRGDVPTRAPQTDRRPGLLPGFWSGPPRRS